jgi:zinc protease
MGKGRKAAIAALAAASAAGAMVLAVPAAAQKAPGGATRTAAGKISVPPLEFKERRLKNGLRVITLRDTTTPNVMTSVWYEVGSKHDPEGRSGFAHLFEHILSRKTRNMPYNMINSLVEDVGGIRNASTGFDRTNYYEVVPAQYLETMLWTHAERMARPVVDPQVFETERGIVKEEYRRGILAPPYGRARLLVTENAFDRLPHRRPGIGSIEQLDAARVEDARAFHEAYYGPDTASLIVSGNFDQKQLDAWIDRYFGGIAPRTSKASLAIAERDAPRRAPRLSTLYAPNVPLPTIGSVWQTPAYVHADSAPLHLLDRILAGGESSRLYRALVRERQVAAQVSVQMLLTEEQGYIAPIVTLASGKGVEEGEAALAAEIARVRSAPVTAAELSEAKNEYLADQLRQRETFDDRASGLGEALVRSGDARAWDKRIAEVQRVTAADVQRVARKYLAPGARVDLRYLDEKAKPQGVAADGWANPVPMPRFKTVAPAVRPAFELAAEGEREQPPAPGKAVTVTPPAISETRLATGLSVVTAKSSDVPLATMAVVLKGGAATFGRDKGGLANLAADLAAKGTRTRSSEQVAAELESLGAELDTGAGADGAILSVSAPVANLEAAGRILADIVENATFPEAEFQLGRKRARDALSVSLKSPDAIASMVATRLVYGDAPYGTLAAGTPGSLASLTRQDLVDYHRRWWHPGNAAVVISGGIEQGAANALAARLFGSWKGEGSAPALPSARAGAARAPKTIVIDMPGAGQAAVLAAVRALPRSDPDYYRLNIANAVLGVGTTSRLYSEVRTKRALSYAVSSGIGARFDTGLLTTAAQTKNETAAELAQIFLTEIERLGAEPLAGSDVERRITFLTGNLGRQMQTSAGLAAILGSLIQQGVPPSEAARLVRQMQSVTPAGASEVAKRIADADQATLVVVGESSQFLDKLKAVRGDIEVIPLAELDLDSPTLRRRP